MLQDTDERIIASQEKSDDADFETTLRPGTLEEYVGQQQIKQNLHVFLQAAKQRQQALEHVLLHGAPGLGKTTLAHILAKEMGVGLRITSGPAIERAGDLAAILSNLEPGSILFIDEIHRLNRTIEEVLYPAMEDFQLDIVIGKGPAARTVRLDLPRFTLVGATTRMSLISSPLRDRFGNTFRLEFYEPKELVAIIRRAAGILKIPIDQAAAEIIAARSRRTPRIANRLLKRVRDYAEVHGDGRITAAIATEALDQLEIDPLGLDQVDRKILQQIIEKFQGGPVGLTTIAAAVAEEVATVEDIYEPFLLQLGFLARTPRGRVATAAAYRHLGLPEPEHPAALPL